MAGHPVICDEDRSEALPVARHPVLFPKAQAEGKRACGKFRPLNPGAHAWAGAERACLGAGMRVRIWRGPNPVVRGGMNSDRVLFIPWKDMTDNLHSSDRVRSEIRVIQRSARRPKWRKVERPASGRGARFWSVFYPTRSNRTGTGNRQESGCGTLHSWP